MSCQEAVNYSGAARSILTRRQYPLSLQHINVHGTYHFTLPESVAQGYRRPFRPLAASSESLG
jgi:hypothetical protein